MSHISDLPFLSYTHCESLDIAIRDVVTCIERLLRGAAVGQVWSAPKSAFMTADGRYMMATLSACDDPPLMVVKSLMVSPDNSKRGLENINSVVVIHDGESGLPVAVIDGNWITAVRTAALSGVAAKYLARRNAAVAAFIGCGVQANSHLDAFKCLFPLEEVRAVGRGAANRDHLCERARNMGLRAIASDDAQSAIEGADLVVTSLPVSYDKKPFIDARWVKAGCFCTITDLAIPWIPESMTIFDRIVIDDMEQERQMEKPLVARELLDGDISGLVLGETSSRATESERCAFVFRGLAIGDLALAALAWQRHTQLASKGAPTDHRS